MSTFPLASARPLDLSESELVRRAMSRDPQAIREIIRANNQRLYRLARAVLHNSSDAEDVVQETYLKAFGKLSSFQAQSSLSTWLSSIVLNEARMRMRSQKRLKRQAQETSSERSEAQVIPFPQTSVDPEKSMAQRQLLALVDSAIDHLPEAFRLVFIARVVEGLSVEETASLLELRPGTVKTRLYRARKMVREQLEAQVGPVLVSAFPFAGERCDRLTATVLLRLGL